MLSGVGSRRDGMSFPSSVNFFSSFAFISLLIFGVNVGTVDMVDFSSSSFSLWGCFRACVEKGSYWNVCCAFTVTVCSFFDLSTSD